MIKDNSFTVPHFNIQSLAIEIFKVTNNVGATIIDDLFTIYHNCDLRSKSKFVVPSVCTVLQSPCLEYDTRLHKRFGSIRHIQRLNRKMEAHKLPLSPLQKMHTKFMLHTSDLIQYFCL